MAKAKSIRVLTPPFRVAFANVFEPKVNTLNNKEEYSLVALFKKGENLEALKKAVDEMAVAKFGPAKAKQVRKPFRDQGEKVRETDDGKTYLPQGYEAGAILINLKSSRKPPVIGPDKNPIVDDVDFYSGCWARAAISVYAYDANGNRGVACGLEALQKVKDDTPFGGRVDPEAFFEAIETSDQGSSLEALLG